MSRTRTINKDLPQRVYVRHGAYFFFPREPMLDPSTGTMRSWLRLCPTSAGKIRMRASLTALIGGVAHVPGSMPFLCADFKATKLKKYSDEVCAQYSQYLEVIADEFEAFQVAEVTTKEFADFLHDRFGDKANTAKKYAGLARKLFKHGISRHGFRKDNPIDQLDLGDFETKRRETLPTHDQVRQIREQGMMSKRRNATGKQLLTASGPMFACIIDMTYLLWARAIDIRMLREDQIADGRIRIKASKTKNTSGKIVDFAVTTEIQGVLDRARAIKAGYELKSDAGYLFPSQKGTPYTKSGLFSMWDRARERAGITDSVWFKDLRALGATDALKAGEGRKGIQTRLAHTSEKTTEIYLKEAVPEASCIDLALPWNIG